MNRLIPGLACAALLAACASLGDPYTPRLKNAGIGYQERPNPDGGFTLLVETPSVKGPDLPRQLFDRRADELCDHAVASTNTFRADRAVFPDAYRNPVLGDYILEGYVYCQAAAKAAP